VGVCVELNVWTPGALKNLYLNAKILSSRPNPKFTQQISEINLKISLSSLTLP